MKKSCSLILLFFLLASISTSVLADEARIPIRGTISKSFSSSDVGEDTENVAKENNKVVISAKKLPITGEKSAAPTFLIGIASCILLLLVLKGRMKNEK